MDDYDELIGTPIETTKDIAFTRIESMRRLLDPKGLGGTVPEPDEDFEPPVTGVDE